VLTLRYTISYITDINIKGGGEMLDEEWVALIEEAKALGLTVEGIREELEKLKEENV
jgi:hypothetical protein